MESNNIYEFSEQPHYTALYTTTCAPHSQPQPLQSQHGAPHSQLQHGTPLSQPQHGTSLSQPQHGTPLSQLQERAAPSHHGDLLSQAQQSYAPQTAEPAHVTPPEPPPATARAARGTRRAEGASRGKPGADTSAFTIEERLVAAVWIHERRHTHHTITEIKAKFVERFGREPPSKTTLFAWERKLFATGNVCDAPRPGRPDKRQRHAAAVAESLRAAPALSVRARAAALRLPRTTLHNIIKKDLLHPDTARHADKAAERRARPPRRKSPAAPPAAPAHSHMHYVMHAMHTHANTY